MKTPGLLKVIAALTMVLGCASSPPGVAISSPAMPSASSAPQATLVVTTASAPFVSTRVGGAPATGASDVSVAPAKALHQIDGFGGAFNERGWAALSVLAEPVRESVLRALFHPSEGLRFNLGRTPIGASDYALDRYTLNETPGDYAMQHFSIARDRQALLPYIRAAMKYRPDLKVWGSAWTPRPG
jgi:glucosylceramidase